MNTYIIFIRPYTHQLLLYITICCLFSSCAAQEAPHNYSSVPIDQVHTAASRMHKYLPLLKDKTVACVVNQTSVIGRTHLVDTLLSHEVDIQQIWVPEHGFRGKADAGEHIDDGLDPKTGITVVSLYGTNKKPKPEYFAGVDVVLFDLQDVGVRFYTYISTLTYVMEACAEQKIPLIVLDRPNPNGHYIDGPVLDRAFRSFVGMHPVPIVYGMTIGEYALMVYGEEWINQSKGLALTVIPCRGYDHNTLYDPPVRPSPNLPNLRSILLYPSLCLFEGTPVSIGRGTNMQFQVIGHPAYDGDFSFTPSSREGAKHPKLEGELCRGISLLDQEPEHLFRHWQTIDVEYLIRFYQQLNLGPDFFTSFFDKLAGTDELRTQIIQGLSADTIRSYWKTDIDDFQQIRKKYLLYPDFQ